MDISIHTGVVIELRIFGDEDTSRQKIIDSNGIFSIFNGEIIGFFKRSIDSNGIFTHQCASTQNTILVTLLRRICRKNKERKHPRFLKKVGF